MASDHRSARRGPLWEVRVRTSIRWRLFLVYRHPAVRQPPRPTLRVLRRALPLSLTTCSVHGEKGGRGGNGATWREGVLAGVRSAQERRAVWGAVRGALLSRTGFLHSGLSLQGHREEVGLALANEAAPPGFPSAQTPGEDWRGALLEGSCVAASPRIHARPTAVPCCHRHS